MPLAQLRYSLMAGCLFTFIAVFASIQKAAAHEPASEQRLLRAIMRAENPSLVSRSTGTIEKGSSELQRYLEFDAPRSGLPSRAFVGPLGPLQESLEDEFWADGFGSPISTPGTDGIVWALLEFDEEFIVAGEFSTAGGTPANNIARWDGSSWKLLDSGLNGTVFALAIYDGDLFAGGLFTTAGGTPSAYIARWDGVSWSSLGSGVSGAVRALQVHENRLVVGGDFGQAGGAAAAQIAQWDGAEWSAMGGGFAGGFSGLGVRALTVYEGDLVAGGFFTAAEDGPLKHIARWNGSIWEPIGVWTKDTVYSLVVHDGGLVAGCVVWRADLGTWVDMIQRFDGSVWSSMGSGPLDSPFPNAVRALAVFQGDLIAAGQFPRAGGEIVGFTARWDGTIWIPLATGLSNDVFALGNFAGDLIAGGRFFNAGTVPVAHVARWDGAGWHALGSTEPGLGVNGIVWGLFEHGGRLVAGGEFTEAGLVSANHVAAFDGSTWTALGSGTDGRVSTFTEFAGELVAGGAFEFAGGQPAGHIARWNGNSWNHLGGGVSGDVHAVVEYDGDLIVGGDFDYAGGTPASKIARWDGTAWHPMGAGLTGGFDDLGVRSLAIFKDRLYVVGHFTASGATLTRHVARWDDRFEIWEPVGKGLPGAGYALISDSRDQKVGKNLYAGSVVWFPGTGTWGDIIRRWPGNWKPLGSGVLAEPFPNAGRAFTFRGGRLVAAGQFPDAAGETVNYVAKWDGTSWNPFGSGTNAPVYAVANFLGSLFIGGEFTTAGNKQSSRIARWDGPPDPSFEPLDLAVVALRDGTRLTWSFTDETVSGLAAVHVERKVTGGAYASLTPSPLLPSRLMVYVDVGVDPGVLRWYRVVLIPHSGSPTTSAPVLSSTAAVGREPGFDLVGPDHDGTIRFTFGVARSNTPVELRIYNVRGHLVSEVVRERYEPGVHTYRWDCRTEKRTALARGVYVASIQVGYARSTRKFVILDD